MVTWRIPDSRKELSRYYTGAEKYLTSIPGEFPIDDTAAQLRRIVEAVSLTKPEAAHLLSITDRLRDIADELERHTEPPADRLFGMWEGDGVVRHDPVTGPENTLAPPLVMHVVEDGWVEGGPAVSGSTRRRALRHLRGTARCRTRRRQSPCRKQRDDREARDPLPAPHPAV